MTPATQPNIEATTDTLLSALDARSKDIVTRRYGLKSGQPETLESIGKEYGITRERVRQIQSQAKKALIELTQPLAPIAEAFDRVMAAHGGIMSESHAIRAIQQELTGPAPSAATVMFYLDVLPNYRYVSRDPLFAPHWRHTSHVNPDAEATIKAARDSLKKTKHPITQDELVEQIRRARNRNEAELPTRHIIAQLTASKAIDETPFGEWGISTWPETNPRGVGDKAYAVLRRHGKPEHFTVITRLINDAQFDHKRANPQTVHNELIKDSRFVLVGRGLYGLTEWGFIPGTVADVIERLLQEANEPLSREEVIERVLAQRQVKKNTILLGLQNQKRFLKTADHRYTLRAK